MIFLPLSRRVVNGPGQSFTFALLLGGCLLAGCGPIPEPVDEGVKSPQAMAINTFQTKWATKLEFKHGQITRLYTRDALLIGYTADGTSYVLDRPTGKILHVETIKGGDEALRPPVVLKDFIVYPTTAALEIYDKEGALVRHKELGYSIRSDAVGARTFVYLGGDFVGGGRLVKIDVTNPYLDNRWELMFPDAAVQAAPAVFNDTIYAAATNGDVTALSYDTRAPLWPVPGGFFHTYDAIRANLAADETGVYVASTDTKLCALNRGNGKVKWQYDAKAYLTDGPIVTKDKDLVFQHVPGVGFVALDKGVGAYNRQPRWTAPDIIQILSSDDKYVYALRSDKEMIALDKRDGHAMFTSRRKDVVTYSTNPYDGTIYAVTNANRVLAINAVLKPGVVGEIAWTPLKEENLGVAMAR